MSFHSYPVYKPSGIEWLGEVPEHWEVKRIASLYSEVIEAGNEDLPVLSVSIHHGVSDSELGEEDMDRKVTRSEDRSKYKRVAPGDLVYNMMRAWQGAFGSVVVEGMVSPAYVVARPKTTLSTEWIEYLLRTDLAVNEIKRFSRGITDFRLRLYWDEFKNLRICEPPEQERACILRFLDRETAKIDALIAEQQRLIELLQEKRQAVISHAVTKGLNPNAPMKDSGVEWLGEVPEHWQVRPLKSEIFFQEGPGIMAIDFMDEGIPLLRVSCVQGERVSLDGCNYLDPKKVAQKWAHFMVSEGDLLLSGSASLGVVSEVGEETAGSIPYTGLIRVGPSSRRISRDFIKLLIESSVFSIQIDRLKAGATIQHFGPTHLRQMKITLPPADEQELITNELGRTKTAFNGLIEKAEQAVALLQERRSALISAAVTGQIDVRGLVEAEGSEQ